jgi:hypothetical protein
MRFVAFHPTLQLWIRKVALCLMCTECCKCEFVCLLRRVAQQKVQAGTSAIPDAVVPAIQVANKYGVQPFETISVPGARYGARVGETVVSQPAESNEIIQPDPRALGAALYARVERYSITDVIRRLHWQPIVSAMAIFRQLRGHHCGKLRRLAL